ncbi:MAG: PAS domain-containing protein [Bacteroidales bacterium]|nr:PAS domain-containing protein [Bacteroidales bacterium]
MAKFKIKELSLQIKIAILTIIVILFTISILFIINSSKKRFTEKKQYLTEVYLNKNTQINSCQRVLNSFIVFNHISYEKLDDFIDIQNAFFQTTDSINFYIKQYANQTATFEENETIDNFNTEFQKFQNIIYEIFNEYKNEIINLKNISRLFNKELISYQKTTEILNKLKTYNNTSFFKAIKEMEGEIKRLSIISFVSLISFLIIFISLLIYFFKDNITATISAEKLLLKLSKGEKFELSKNLHSKKQPIFEHINTLGKKYNKIDNYINELINKNYNLDIQKEEQNNILEKTLIKLSKNLLEAEKDIEIRKEDDRQKEWANKGMNMFADLMRQHSNNLQNLTDEIIKNFVKYLQASVGGLFIVQDEETDPHLELISAFAYDRKKHYTKRVNFGEGLVGTVAIDKSTIHLSNIPADYLEIESGLGDAPPNNLLILPLLTDTGLLGVIEIASFRSLQKYEIDLSETLSRSIASTLESVKINARTILLLKESQKKSDELVQREKILQETMEEVSKAHEIARKNEIETRGILSGVDQTLMRAEYYPNGNFINSNMVHRRVMGYDIDKMKGKNILEFIPEEDKTSFQKIWNEVASGRPYQITVKRKNKQTEADVWLLNQYTPIKDDSGNVIKILYLAIDISEQKQAEEKANQLLIDTQEKEIELRGILTGIDRTILRAEYTPDGIFINSNKIHQTIIGYELKSMIGKSILDFVQDEAKSEFVNLWKQIKAGSHRELIAKRINKQSNEDIWLFNQYNPILDENGKVSKILYLAIDITDEKRNEERIQLLLKEAKEKEIEISGLFTGVDQTLMRAEYSVNGDFLDANDIHANTLGYDIENMRGKNIMEFIPDEEKEQFTKIWNNVKRGGLEQITVKRKNKETNEDIWLLNQYTPINNQEQDIVKILYLAIDITEQKRTEERAKTLLKNSREKEIEIAGILSAVDQTLMRAEYDLDGRFIDANTIHTQLLGYDIEKMRGQNILEFIPDDEKESFISIWENVKAGNAEQITVKRKNKNTNDDLWLLNQYTPVKNDEGKTFKILYLAIDITEQKQTEQMAADLLQESKIQEIELSAILSSIDQTLMRAEYTIDGNFINANEIHAHTLGYEIEKMRGQNILEFVPDEEKDFFNELWQRVKQGIPEQITVKRQNKQTNEDIWLLNQYTPIKDENEKVSKILYLAIDITEQKQAEQMAADLLLDAQKQEFELGTIINAIDQSLLRARYTKEGIFIDSNEVHRKIMGYNIEDMYGKNILEFIPEQEFDEFKETWAQLTKGEPKTLVVHRYNKSTGKDIWLQNEYTPVLDINQEVNEILYLGIDITHQKQLEQQTAKLLTESLEKENQLTGLLSGVDQTLMRAEYTPDGIFISANQKHVQVLGYDYNSMLGKNILEFINSDEKDGFILTWNKIKNGEAQNITVKRKNQQTGEDIWLLNQYTPLSNDKGKVEKILYLAIDISEQKRLEQELLVQEQIMNQNMEELYVEFERLERENDELNELKEEINIQFDSEQDKQYNNWLNSFE